MFDHVILLNSSISTFSCFLAFFLISIKTIMPSANRCNFLFQFLCLFFPLTTWTRPPVQCWSKVVRFNIHALRSIFREDVQHVTTECNISCRKFKYTHYQIKCVSFCSLCAERFYNKCVLHYLNYFPTCKLSFDFKPLFY